MCVFVFAYAKSRFSHDEAHIFMDRIHNSVKSCFLQFPKMTNFHHRLLITITVYCLLLFQKCRRVDACKCVLCSQPSPCIQFILVLRVHFRATIQCKSFYF